MESNTAPAKQSGLQPGCCMVGWSALSSDRAHPLFSAHTTELPPDPQQGVCRFAPDFSLMSCLCKSMLWERHKMNTKTKVQAWPANPSCMSLDLVPVVAVAILFYCISTWTKLVHSCPRRQQKPRALGWGQVLGPQYQGNLETFFI